MLVFSDCKGSLFLSVRQIFIVILLAMSVFRSNFEVKIQNMEDFVHLHVHTHYSILDGQSKVPHLVDKAIKDGMKGMAITAHGVMYGIQEFSDYCAKVNAGRKK